MAEQAEKSSGQTAAAKGCKKKRGRKDLMMAKMHTDKNKARRVATNERRAAAHRSKLCSWAARNGVRFCDVGGYRQAVRELRAG